MDTYVTSADIIPSTTLHFLGYNKAEKSRTGLADRYDCYAGLWENCCTNDQWIKIPENVIFDGSGSGDGGSGDINELECHSLITVGFKYEPILLPDSNDPMQEFAAVQLWIIRVTMLIAASMPFIAIIGGIKIHSTNLNNYTLKFLLKMI